jgi:hypothetical protein
MFNKRKIILLVILAAFFFRGIFLVAVFPIFKGQDESRHYNTVQYILAGKDRVGQRDEEVIGKQIKEDLSTYRYSDEIRRTATIAQTERVRGNYYDKVSFLDGNINGLREESFKAKQYPVPQHVYPSDIAKNSFGLDGFSLYHHLLVGAEELLSLKNIFIKYYTLRSISILLGVIMLWMAYCIFRVVDFSKKQSLILIAVISFQPKLVIYFTNINYDVLLIPLWTGFVLVGVTILKNGWSLLRAAVLFLLLAGAISTKPSALPLLGAAVFLIGRTFYKKFKNQKSLKKINWLNIGVVVIALGVISYLLLDKVGITAMFASKNMSMLGEYLSKSLPKIYGSSRDYWGAIGWSQGNLTLWYVKIIWAIEWLAWLGLGIWIVGPWLKKVTSKFSNFAEIQSLQNCRDWISAKYIGFSIELKKQKKYFWFALVSVAVLQIGIRVADWGVFVSSHKLVLGTPGRYWLPNIVPHFILLAMGLKVVTGLVRSKKTREKYFEFSLLLFLVIMILYWVYEVIGINIPRYYL